MKLKTKFVQKSRRWQYFCYIVKNLKSTSNLEIQKEKLFKRNNSFFFFSTAANMYVHNIELIYFLYHNFVFNL